MKRFLKTFLATVMALLMAVGVLAGCKATMNDYPVGKVGDMDIMASVFYNQCSSYAQMYSYYGLSAELYMDDIKETVFNALVDQYLPIYHAKKAGIKLDAEDEKIVKENLDTFVKDSIESYKASVDASITDEAAIQAEAEKLFKETIEANGYKYDEYINKIMYEEYANARLSEKMYEKILADANIDITDDDVLAKFNEELEAEKTSFAESPANYYSYYSNYISSAYSEDEAQKKSAVPPLVIPEGYFYVKHILVMNPAEDEEKDVDSIVAEIQAELSNLAETATAEEKIAKFNELIEKYNEDPGMENEPYKTEGYLMHESLNTEESKTYDPPFYEAAMKLEKEGDISEPVEGENGTHIIIRLGDVDSTKTVEFEEVKEAIRLNLVAQAENEAYTTQIEKWKKETKITKNESRIAALNVVVSTEAMGDLGL